MGKITDRINGVLREFAKQVNEEILAGRTRTVERGSHTVTIEVLGERVRIWTENERTFCRCNALVVNGLSGDIHFPDFHSDSNAFRKPATCWKIVTALTDKEREEQVKVKRREKARLERELEKLTAETEEDKEN